MGGRYQRNLENDDTADVAAIKFAINAGITHIDTAEIYADGHSEELVAEAVKDYERSKIFLASKVQAAHMAYKDIILACRASLKRLQTDYLDLYLLHQHNPSFSLKDTMRALDRLVADGLVKHIGVSNFKTESLERAQEYAKNKIVCNQVHYNLKAREPERSGLLEFCQKNDVMLVAYRPVEKGRLLENIPGVVKKICKKYKRTPAQIAINWLVSQANVVTLAKTRNSAHLKENLGGVGWQMDKEDIEKLRVEYPEQIFVSDVVPLG